MSDILETLLGSKARVRILRFFFLNPDGEFSAIDIIEKNMLSGLEVKKELNNFEKIKLINSKLVKKKKHYQINKEFPFYAEFERLVSRSNIEPSSINLAKIKGVGNVKLALISGVFINYPKSRADFLLIVDNVSRVKLKGLVTMLEAEVGKEIRYMVLSSEEFNYRLDMLDRFLLEFLKSPHEVVINKIPKYKSIVASIR